MARSRPRQRSLASLAKSLDTRKRALPADARSATVALRPRAKETAKSAPAPRSSPVPPVPRARPQGSVTRSAALSSLDKKPSPRPSSQPSANAPSPDARRRYPRADLGVQARLLMADDPTRFFEATLATTNISVGGMFLSSTFFLKLGTQLLVELTLPRSDRVVRVRGEVVRVETQSDTTGFALRFSEYLDGSEVVLATHFLSPVLREFITAYAKRHRFAASPEYIAHTADVLAAWELRKAELGSDVWSLVGP